jgi:NAD(P)-dependent dehydrogenase (short-subunit alcohol dehydrogenase family)
MNAPEALHGKAAIVTGAAQGLGYAISKAYVQHGMKVALIDVKADVLAQVVQEFIGMGGRCAGIPADLTDAEQTQAAVGRALELYGTPRTLVHNAAILDMLPFEQVDLAEWTRTVNVGIQAAYLLTWAVWTRMSEAGGGSVVYVSSRSGVEGFAGEAAYCTAKHGLEGLMKALALEGKPRNIAVNTITPGMYMHTPMSEQNYNPEARQKWVDPAALTPAFVHLARQDAGGVTGQRLSAWELSQQYPEG